MKYLKRAAFIAVFVAVMVVWYLAMTGLQFVVLPLIVGPIWAGWWGFVLAFGGMFWFALWMFERWATWTKRGIL